MLDQTSLDTLKTELLAEIAAATDSRVLDEARVEALGKKGRITALMKGLGGQIGRAHV